MTTLLSPPAQSSALLTAVPWETAWPRLPGKVRTAVLRLDAWMRQIAAAPKVRPAIEALARRHADVPGMSVQTLKRHFYRWRRDGMAALVDHRQCGGCGLLGCTWARAGGKLPPAVIERWAGEAGLNDKQALREAWRVLMRDLCAGEPVVEGVTWQTIHAQVWPGLGLPERCPWSIHHPPPGWSLSNFMEAKPVKAVYLALKKGASAAWNETPEVRMDLDSLRPFEALVFDDHEVDFLCQVWDDRGKVQVVEMHGLFAMDVATGTVLEFGLRPALLREDGTREGITTRDMQHLIAHLLARYGFPLDHTMTLIVENAAAAVTAETEHLIRSRTGGQVVVRRTGVHFGAVNVRGFPERWGAPRGKAWLESWFHLLDIALGSVRGQKGSNWTVKPGHTDGMKWLAERMAAVVTAHPELARQLEGPLHWAQDAHWIVSAAIDALNNRTHHSMERHALVTEWRFSPADPVPKPALALPGLDTATRQAVEWFRTQPPEVQGLLINNHGQPRRESPLEKMQRTWQRDRFAVIPPDTLLDLLLDSAPAIYRGGDVLDVETGRKGRRKTLRYVATEGAQRLALGQRVLARLDSDRPAAGAWLHDEQERFLGYWRFERDPKMLGEGEDLDILQRRLGAKAKAHKEVITGAAKLALRTPAARGEMAARERNIELVETLGLAAPATAALPAAASTDLAAAVLSQQPVRAARKRKPVFRRAAAVEQLSARADTDDGFSFE